MVCLFFVLPAFCMCGITAVMMLLGAIGIVQDAKNFHDDDMIPGAIFFVVVTLLTIGLAFQLWSRQRPILKIHKEGLWIRTIGVPARGNSYLAYLVGIAGCVLGGVFGIILLLLIKSLCMLWHVITLKLFQIQIVRLQWENIVDVQAIKSTWTRNAELTIAGLYGKEYNDFTQEFSLEPYVIAYGESDFYSDIAKVSEAVQYFLRNPDEWATLPSWHDEDLFGSGGVFADDVKPNEFESFGRTEVFRFDDR